MKQITLNVAGMMCGHCEARVQDALNKLDGIKECKADSQTNQVHLSYEEDIIKEAEIIDAIEACGYDVLR